MSFDWSDVVPEAVAERQRQWERRHKARRLRYVGVKTRTIAAAFSVSMGSVQKLIRKAQRELVQCSREPSPIEKYLSGNLIVLPNGYLVEHQVAKRFLLPVSGPVYPEGASP